MIWARSARFVIAHTTVRCLVIISVALHLTACERSSGDDPRRDATEQAPQDVFSSLPPDSTTLEAVLLCDGIEPSVSPNGRFVAYAGWSDVWLYDIEARTTRRLCAARSPSGIAWSPSGTQLAFNSSDYQGMWNRIWIVNADGSGLRKLDDAGVDDQHPVWSPSGESLVWTRVNRLWQADLDGTGGRFITKSPERFHQEFARGWTADGIHLLYISGSQMGGEYRLRVVGRDSTDDVADSTRVPAVHRSGLGVADGGALLFRAWRDTIEFAERGATGRVRRIFTRGANAFRLSLASDKSFCVFDDGDQDQPRIWLVKLKQ